MLHLRIPKSLFDYMLTDLKRQHAFAYERVGFLLINKGITKENTLLLASDYIPVADEYYLRDTEVGAKINSSAVREIMQKILDTGHGALHVHIHSFPGEPRFSKVDIVNLKLLIPSFQRMAPNTINGALLIQNDSLKSLIWMPREETPQEISRITIIGRPIEFYGRY